MTIACSVLIKNIVHKYFIIILSSIQEVKGEKRFYEYGLFKTSVNKYMWFWVHTLTEEVTE